ncbi:MAG TPA: Hpt domain-containing protein [Steroidobacteraceae bacterium]
MPTVPAHEPSSFAQTLRITPSHEQDRAADPGATASELAATDIPAITPPTLRPMVVPEPARAMIDPELLALFIDEARDEIAKIQRRYPVWDQNPLETDALNTVRRSFHTLKGSGRMVGARELADFAWSIENLLNRILDNTLTRSPAILATISQAVAALPELIEQLAHGTALQTDVTAIVTRAHALAAMRAPEVVPASADAHSETDVIASSLSIPPRPEPPAEIVLFGEEPAPAAAAQERAPLPSAPHVEVDYQLREIYARETHTHAATVRRYVEHERMQPAPHILPEEVYRACHTLSGSSKMAEARHGIQLAEALDHWLRKSFDSSVGLNDTDLNVINDCMAAMELVAGHLDESTGYFASQDGLRARIARADSDLDRRIAEAALAAHGTAPPSEQPSSATTADDSGTRFVQALRMPEAPVEDGAAVADYDPEIAAIFTDEATELLDAAQAALAGWNEARGSAEPLAALKRPLHTLKGGARMAGVTPMGDLSHELESLVMQIDSGAVAGDERAYAAAQATLDQLAQMREAVASGQPVKPALALIARLQALAGGAAEAAPAAAPAPPAAELGAPSQREEAPPPAPQAPPAHELPANGLVSSTAWPLLTDSESISFEVHVDQLPAESAVREAEPVAGELAHDAASDTDVLRADLAPLAAAAEAAAAAQTAAEEPIAAPAAVPPGREPVAPGDRPELARVDAELLDQLLNSAGEVSISRARLEQQLGSIDFNLGELSRTVTRLKDQLRNLEIETERQILNRHEAESGHRGDFDPLELDRYSSIQQFSRALAETASDVASIQQLLESLTQDTQNLLQQQARTVTELQNGLMRTRMVPFQRHVPRLARIVRQAASDTGKQAELTVEGAAGELDRQVLERMMPPFEHMLRNAVVHGIEAPEVRLARGKSETGRITLGLRREGAEVIVQLSDDGAGMNVPAIRAKGISLGLIRASQTILDEDVMQLVLEPGFSTAGSVTQAAGRGVGMDVVATEVKKLGGALHMQSTPGEGSQFTIRLPFTLAISHALVVRTGEEYYALPLPTVEGVVRLSKREVVAHLGPDAPPFDYAGQKYRFQHLAAFVGLEPSPLPELDVTIPVVMVRAGEHSTGLVTDELVGSREIVVKSVGSQISTIRGISGATILGDGRIVVILDIGALVRAEWRGRSDALPPVDRADKRTFALVVDDSITVRRVTQRLLERNGMRVLTARDGLDAVTLLQEHTPDIILLDIEMPRMDGYEVAAHVRSDPRLAETPIIMITSRAGEKHRARAIELGVDDYLGKPYQEAQLLEAIEPLVARRRDRPRRSANVQRP